MSRWMHTWSMLLGLALAAPGPALGQFPPQNIPPTRVPETEEPDVADKSKAADLPDRARQAIIGSVAPTRAPFAAPAPRTAPDPPTPSVAIHVSAPASISAGADVEYKIVVENKSSAPAHHVQVSNPIPRGAALQSAEPTADDTRPGSLVWKLGTLKPGESRTIKLVLRPFQDGLEAIENTARVQFEHGQMVRTVLKRPQLTIKKMTHLHALEKQPIACKLVVENSGEVEVVNIQVREALNEGLLFEADADRASPVKTWTIGSLAPKQKKEFTYNLVGEKSGTLGSHVVATAERGVVTGHDWHINVGPSPLTVKMTGPREIYLNYPAKYDIQLNYSGTTALENVVVAFNLARGMKVARATPGAQDFKDRVQWTIARLNPQEKRSFSVSVQMANAGTVPNFVNVLWHGPEQRDELVTEFRGAVALQLSLHESNNPIRVGDKVRYTITVTNRGNAPTKDKDVKLIVKFPVSQFALDPDGSDGKQPTGADGKPLPETQVEILLPAIPPKDKATRQITLKATHPGKAIVHVEMESSELPSGNVIKQEPATITE
jgi:uncharacterized repeat protein (TIGR01451 family)